MSQVVKAITAFDTGERRWKPAKSRLFQDVFSVKEEIYELRGDKIAKVYEIDVTIGNRCMVSEDLSTSHNNALSEAIQRTKQQVIEAIFGEFRQDFRIIERHLYNYEYEEAAAALREMEQKMFSED